MATKFSSPPDQRFECRDCPARCCRVPWQIKFSTEEAERYIAEPWVQERAGIDGLNVIAGGVLPMREHERRLQCVFLDDDHLCGLQKQFGHNYIPSACQAFPFGFLKNEKGLVVAQLSHLCPSIRDNYGKPVDKQLKAKLSQKGEAERMTTAMSTVGRVMLSQKQYLKVVRSWEKQLRAELSPAEVLAQLYDQLSVFDSALPEGVERVPDKMIETALQGAREHLAEPLESAPKPSFHARALFSYLLGNLCYPSRVRASHRVGKKAMFLRLRSFANKMAWMRDRGTVDMLFTAGAFKLQGVRKVERFLHQPAGGLVRDYLLTMIERRQLFSKPRYLMDALVDMCLATVLVSRFARCAALAHGRDTVTPADVRDGISVAELVLISHVSRDAEGATLENLRMLMVADRDRLRALLGSEA